MSADRPAAAADVVVIGGGGSGMAAAITAAELGRKVILLEKNPRLGGSTAWSVGSVTSSCTPHQIRAGILDSPEEHWADYKVLAGERAARDNFELSAVMVRNLPDTFRWLLTNGLEFMGPVSEAPHRRPRMHNILPNSRAFPYHLGRRCRKVGVDVRLGTRALDLVKQDGRIARVRAAGPDGREYLIETNSVVLAAGDYSASPEFKAQLVSAEAATVDPVNATATGDGFRLAMAHGATMVNGDVLLGPTLRFVPPARNLLQMIPPWRWLTRFMRLAMEHLPPALLRPFIMRFLVTAVGPETALYREGAILVNKLGARFTDEVQSPNGGTSLQPGRLAYIVFDARVAATFSAYPNFISTAPGIAYAYLDDYRRARPDIYRCAPTLSALASRLGIAPDALQDTVDAYNAGRGPEGVGGRGTRPPLAEGPYYALGPVRTYVVSTDGTLPVTLRHEVLDGSGRAIPGLFAAGSNGQGGMLLLGHGHHLGWAFTSGRLAGKEAAFFRPARPAPDSSP